MTTIAVIPARGGSKRLPDKNLRQLAGQSLVCRAIRTAFESKLFKHVVLTTDADEIIEHASSNFNHLTIFKRPSELAQDDTPMLPVVRHAAETYAANFKTPPDDIVLLQPTSPLRIVDDVIAAFDLYSKLRADAVVSVTAPDADMVFRVGHAGRMRADPGVVVPNGAIYIISLPALMCGHDWYSGISYAYKMPKDRSIDIDTERDLVMAKAVMENENAA